MDRKQLSQDRALDTASRMISELRLAKAKIAISLEEWADNEQSRACSHIDDAIGELKQAIHFILDKS